MAILPLDALFRPSMADYAGKTSGRYRYLFQRSRPHARRRVAPLEMRLCFPGAHRGSRGRPAAGPSCRARPVTSLAALSEGTRPAPPTWRPSSKSKRAPITMWKAVENLAAHRTQGARRGCRRSRMACIFACYVPRISTTSPTALMLKNGRARRLLLAHDRFHRRPCSTPWPAVIAAAPMAGANPRPGTRERPHHRSAKETGRISPPRLSEASAPASKRVGHPSER